MSVGGLLEIDDVVAGYVPGADILTGCSLSVGAGELVGVIGPNGAGKSTLAKVVMGLVAVRSGRVALDGTDLGRMAPHLRVAAGVGYVPQSDHVFGTLTVEENLRMGTYLRPEDHSRRFDEVAALFEVVTERRSQRAGSLSGGEQKAVAMARALMSGPRILVLDEPSASLSPANQDQVFDHIVAVNRAGVAVLLVEQNARRCLELSHRAYVLDGGANAYQGEGRALLGDDRVIDLYLGRLGRR